MSAPALDKALCALDDATIREALGALRDLELAIASGRPSRAAHLSITRLQRAQFACSLELAMRRRGRNVA